MSNNTHFLGYKTVVYKAHYAVGCNIVAVTDNTVAGSYKVVASIFQMKED